MSLRSIVVVDGDDPGVLDQASQLLAAVASAVGAQVHLGRAEERQVTQLDASPAEHVNRTLADIGTGTVIITAPEVTLDAATLDLLFAAAEEADVVAVPVLAGREGRIRSAGRVEIAHGGRVWLTDLLSREHLTSVTPPRRVELPHASGQVLAVSCERALAVGGLGDGIHGGRAPDTDDFIERLRASGARLTLVGDAVAEVRDAGPCPLWTELVDPHRLGAPPARTAANRSLVTATGVIAQAFRSEPIGGCGAREHAPLVLNAAGAVGADAEELRHLLHGLERAGLEPSAALGADTLTVRVGADVRAAITAAVDRRPPLAGEIWLAAADAWAAPLGEPALLRLAGAAAVTPEVELALRRPRAFAVVPSEAAAEELRDAGIPASRVLVLPPFVAGDETGATGDLAAFLPASDEAVLEASLAGIAAAAAPARVTLTWPTPDLVGRVADLAPAATAARTAIWATGAGRSVAGARAVLALDPWDRWDRRVREALARGIPVVTTAQVAARLAPHERAACRVVAPDDAAAIGQAIREALAAGPAPPPPAEAWSERVRAVVEEARVRMEHEHVEPAPRARVLLVSPWLPARDESAGHLRLVELVQGLRAVGADVDVVAAFDNWDTAHVRDCVDAGALGLAARELPFDLRDRLVRGRYDLVYAHFGELVEWIRGALELAAPGTPLAVDSVDLHYVRMLRQTALEPSAEAFDAALRMRRRELVDYGTADAIITVTEDEHRQLQHALGPVPVHVMPTVHRARTDVPPAAARRGIVFLGGFGHPPNADAVRWLMDEIVPRLRDLGCEEPVVVAGSRMPRELRERVELRGGRAVGFVPRVEPLFDAARCMVAPLRFGAGIKGKIGESLASGLPVVTTTVGAEGFPDDAGIHVADTAAGLAEALAAICRDDASWDRASASGRELVGRLFGPARCEAGLDALLTEVLPAESRT